MQFSQLIGQNILLRIPSLDPVVYQEAKLLGVESGGLWLELQNLTDAALEAMHVQATPRTMIWFYPYHRIDFAMTSIDQPALSEKGFGV